MLRCYKNRGFVSVCVELDEVDIAVHKEEGAGADLHLGGGELSPSRLSRVEQIVTIVVMLLGRIDVLILEAYAVDFVVVVDSPC